MRTVLGILGAYLLLSLVLIFAMRQCRSEVSTRSLALTVPFGELRPAVEAWAEEYREAEDGSLEARAGEVFAVLQPKRHGCLLLLRSRGLERLEQVAGHFEALATPEDPPPRQAPE